MRVAATILAGLCLFGCGQKSADSAAPAIGVTVISSPGRSLGRVVTPRALGWIKDELFVADRSGRVQRFDRTGKPIKELRVVTGDAGFPLGIASRRSGGWILCDTHYAKVRLFDADDHEQKSVEFKDASDLPTCPQRAVEVPDGRIFVTEFGQGESNCVRVFDRDLRFLSKFGAYGDQPGQFMRAVGIAYADGEIFVADISDRILVFDLDGRFLRQFGKTGKSAGEMRYPYGVAVSGPLVYVAEYGNHRVQRFTRRGEPRGLFGQPGQGIGEFSGPWDITIDDRGLLYVADSANHRIVVIDPEKVTWTVGNS